MALNVELLENSFAMVVEKDPNLVANFYDLLFSRYPQAQPLFGRNSRANQEKMLTDALVAVIEHLEDADFLGGTLSALGQKHVTYGVTPEMYGWVGECLVETMVNAAGDAWTDEHTRAWSEAYGAITGLMQGEVVH
jgi:hemoglobin-like flavoprotein